MTENKKTNQVYTLDAIEAVSHQGMKRYRLVGWGLLIVVVVGLIVNWYMPAKRAKWPVAVLLPNKEVGAVKVNAARQWDGFKLAFSDNDVDSEHRHVYHFTYPLKMHDSDAIDDEPMADSDPIDDDEPMADSDPIDDNEPMADSDPIDDEPMADSDPIDDNEPIDYCKEINDNNAKDSRKAINEKIKCWYEEGIRTFIITMSGATLKIKKDFSEWSDTLPSNDRPVLVATVASAPELTDREYGVFRHYIRSKDESDMIATYIESINPSPRNVGIFYVIDAYGRDAKNLLKNRLNLKKETRVNVYGVVLQEDEKKQTQIQALVDEFASDKNEVAIIIGYGPMIKHTLNGLKGLSSFEDPILVVSTFTEEKWRPEQNEQDEPFYEQIRFVGPSIDIDEDNEDWRGVVFQFSYLTLDRALKCKGERGVDKFWNCFTSAELSSTGKHWAPHLEFTELGDSHISMRLLEMIENKENLPYCPKPIEATSN